MSRQSATLFDESPGAVRIRNSRRFKLSGLRYHRPLMTVNAAAGMLDCAEDEVVTLILKGKLVAWNIAKPGASRRELRILARSVAWCASFNGVGKSAERRIWRWSKILALLLRGIPNRPPKSLKYSAVVRSKPAWITGAELRRILNCGSTHIISLVESKALKVLPGTDWRRGPGGSPLIRRDSFLTFLENRLENAMSIRGLP